MKNYQLMLLAAFSVIACKKKDTPLIIVGDTSNLIVTEHNKVINTDTSNAGTTFDCYIDLDFDGESDLYFSSHENDTKEETKGYYVKALVLNYDNSLGKELIVSEMSEAGNWYLTRTKSYGTLGTYPQETNSYQISCENSEGAEKLSRQEGSLIYADMADEISSFPETPATINDFLIAGTDGGYYEGGLNLAGDSIITHHENFMRSCAPQAPFNESLYIPFKLTYTDSNHNDRYGWVEFHLSGDNTLTIIRTAVTKA